MDLADDDCGDGDTWWYVCLLCHQSFREDTWIRAHRRAWHPTASAGLNRVLILSQLADLGVKVKVRRCSTAEATPAVATKKRQTSSKSKPPKKQTQKRKRLNWGGIHHRKRTTKQVKITAPPPPPLSPSPSPKLPETAFMAAADFVEVKEEIPWEVEERNAIDGRLNDNNAFDNAEDGKWILQDDDGGPEPDWFHDASPDSDPIEARSIQISDIIPATTTEEGETVAVAVKVDDPESPEWSTNTNQQPDPPSDPDDPDYIFEHERSKQLQSPDEGALDCPQKRRGRPRGSKTLPKHLRTQRKKIAKAAKAEMVARRKNKKRLELERTKRKYNRKMPPQPRRPPQPPDPKIPEEVEDITAAKPGPKLDLFNPCAKCPLCGNVYGSVNTMKRHQIEVHHFRSRQHLCAQCGATFKTARHLETHYRSHDPESHKRYVCEVCAKTFYTAYLLRRHGSVHRAPSLSCPVRVGSGQGCDRVFKDGTSLIIHTRRAHGTDRPYTCDRDGCGATFKLIVGLRLHTTAIHGGGAYACPKCPDTFRDHTALRAHNISVHQHIKPEQARVNTCRVCGLEFSDRASLKSHEVNVHDYQRGTRSFECRFCSKRYANTYCLQRHEVVHYQPPEPEEVTTTEAKT